MINAALSAPLSESLSPSPDSPLEGWKFVWLLSPPWHNVPTRQYHFAMRLARRGAEILYVENPSAWSSSLKQRAWNKLPLHRAPQTQEVFPGIHLMRPALTLPGCKQSDLIASINGHLIASQITRWVEHHNWSSYSCWCRVPHSRFTLEALHPHTIVYDITDDYELYESDSRCRRLVNEREQQLLSIADLVLITAKELQTKINLQGQQLHWVPNGVEYNLFAQATKGGEIHPSVVAMKKPLICYIGLTSHWMDFDLLEMLGRRWSDQILMLGPIDPRVESRARSIPGIVWGGFVPQTELPPYLRGVDVFIMPHQVNELRKKANPLKIWEYLATGKPFVSVDLPALDPVRHLVDIAADRQQFIQLLQARLEHPLPGRAEASQEFARSQSWDAIFDELLPELMPLLTGHPRRQAGDGQTKKVAHATPGSPRPTSLSSSCPST